MQPQTLNSILPPTHTQHNRRTTLPAFVAAPDLVRRQPMIGGRRDWQPQRASHCSRSKVELISTSAASTQRSHIIHTKKDPNKMPLLLLLPDSLTRQCQHIALPQCDYSQLEYVSSDVWWQQRQHLCDVCSFTNVHRFQKVQLPVACHYWLAAISSLQI